MRAAMRAPFLAHPQLPISIHCVEDLTLRARNQIAETLKAAGIASDCELDVGDGQITHLPTGSYFVFRYHAIGYDLLWHVTDGPASEWLELTSKSWEDLLEQIAHWAQEVYYVATTPDFWEELERSREAITAVEAADTGNAPFTQAEQDQIAVAFEASKLVVRQRYELPEEQVARIEQKLDELVEASRTMGRKDWVNLIGSTGFTLIVGSLLTPEVVQHVLGIALRGIAHLFGVGVPPLPLA
jgi:hypothetical protein